MEAKAKTDDYDGVRRILGQFELVSSVDDVSLPASLFVHEYDQKTVNGVILLKAILANKKQLIVPLSDTGASGLISNLPVLSLVVHFKHVVFLQELLQEEFDNSLKETVPTAKSPESKVELVGHESLAHKLCKFDLSKAYETPLHSAVVQGDNEIFNLMVKIYQKYNIPVEANCFGDFPIHTAAAMGSLERVLSLVSANLGDVKSRNKNNQTPLHVALSYRRVEVAITLLPYESFPFERDNDGRDFFDLAILYHVDVRRIFEALPPQCLSMAIGNGYGTDLMLLASRSSDVATVKSIQNFLQIKGTDIKSSGGFFPIHIAAVCGNLAFLQEFVTAGNVNLVCETSTQQTPFLLAAAGGHVECLVLLSSRGANFRGSDAAGQNALHLILRFGIKNEKNYYKSFETVLKAMHELIFSRDLKGICPVELMMDTRDSKLLSIAANLIFARTKILKFAALGQLSTMLEVIKMDPSVLKETDDLGNTVLHVLFQYYLIHGKALGNEFFTAFSELTRWVLSVTPNIANIQNTLGKSIVMLSTQLKYTPSKKKPMPTDTIRQFLNKVSPVIVAVEPIAQDETDLSFDQTSSANVTQDEIEDIDDADKSEVKSFFFQNSSKRPVSTFKRNVTFALDTQEFCVNLNQPDANKSLAGYNDIVTNQSLQACIYEHHARRVQLLFHTYVNLYGTLDAVNPSREDVIIQHGIGARGHNAAHSAYHNAFVPGPGCRPHSGKLFKIEDFFDQQYFFGSYQARSLFDGIHLLDSLNATVGAPAYVNSFDTTYVEKAYRDNADSQMSQVINGACTPWLALQQHLIAVLKVIDANEQLCLKSVNKSNPNKEIIEQTRKILYQCFRKATLTIPLDTSTQHPKLKQEYLYVLFEFSDLERVLLDNLTVAQREVMFQIRCRSLKQEATNTKSEFLTEIIDPFSAIQPAPQEGLDDTADDSATYTQ